MTASRGVRKRKSEPIGWDTVRELARELPGTEEGMSYGTPAFRVARKFLLRLKEDGDSIAIKTDYDTRDLLMAADPHTFYITDHYRGYPALLVRLSSVHRDDLRKLMQESWRRLASKRLVADYDRRRDSAASRHKS